MFLMAQHTAGDSAFETMKLVRDQGWNDDSVSSATALPRSTPQGHRWHLLKAHLKGHYTTDRLQKA